MRKPILATLAALAVSLAASAPRAAELELKPLGWELSGKTGYVEQDTIPSTEEELKFTYDISGGTGEETVTGVWIAEDVGTAAPPNTEIERADTKTPAGSGTVRFKLTRPTNGWPLGRYRLEVWSGDKAIQTQSFEIVSGQ